MNRPYLKRVASLSVYHYFPGGSSDQIEDLFGPVLYKKKPECLEKNLRKQVWTGNQVHKRAGTGDRTRDSLLQCKEGTLR